MGSENIQHFAGVRFRLNGTGNLRPEFHNLDDNPISVLVPIAMQMSPGREPTRLANVVAQRARLKIGTTALNEVFLIDRIVIYAKEQWTSYPG